MDYGKPRSRVGLFVCQCGCDEIFERVYTTRKPKYKDSTHRMRAYRARSRARALAWAIVKNEYNDDMTWYPEILWRVQHETTRASVWSLVAE